MGNTSLGPHCMHIPLFNIYLDLNTKNKLVNNNTGPVCKKRTGRKTYRTHPRLRSASPYSTQDEVSVANTFLARGKPVLL